jgi:hypothetical protein
MELQEAAKNTTEIDVVEVCYRSVAGGVATWGGWTSEEGEIITFVGTLECAMGFAFMMCVVEVCLDLCKHLLVEFCAFVVLKVQGF